MGPNAVCADYCVGNLGPELGNKCPCPDQICCGVPKEWLTEEMNHPHHWWVRHFLYTPCVSELNWLLFSYQKISSRANGLFPGCRMLFPCVLNISSYTTVPILLTFLNISSYSTVPIQLTSLNISSYTTVPIQLTFLNISSSRYTLLSLTFPLIQQSRYNLLAVLLSQSQDKLDLYTYIYIADLNQPFNLLITFPSHVTDCCLFACF